MDIGHHLCVDVGGVLYLAAVLDVYRRIVGWSMADHLRTEHVTDALDMALFGAGRRAASCSIPTAPSTRALPSVVAARRPGSFLRWD